MIKSLVFDFDGTIADSMQVVIEIYNSILAPAFNIRPIRKDEEELFRSINPKSILQASKISIFRLPVMVLRAHREIGKKIREIRPISNIIEILNELHKSSITLGVCTSNSIKNVLAFLEEHKMLDLFDFIYSGNHIFCKDYLIHKQLK